MDLALVVSGIVADYLTGVVRSEPRDDGLVCLSQVTLFGGRCANRGSNRRDVWKTSLRLAPININ
jgi:hypothetical protein